MRILEDNLRYYNSQGQAKTISISSLAQKTYVYGCRLTRNLDPIFTCFIYLPTSQNYGNDGSFVSVADIVSLLNPSQAGQDFTIPATGYCSNFSDMGSIVNLSYGMTPESIEAYLKIGYLNASNKINETSVLQTMITGTYTLLYTS